MKWNEVTWYSRWGAIILFLIAVPISSFYIGRVYENTKIFLINQLEENKPNQVDFYRNWKIHTDEKTGLEVKYPPDHNPQNKIVTEQDTNQKVTVISFVDTSRQIDEVGYPTISIKYKSTDSEDWKESLLNLYGRNEGETVVSSMATNRSELNFPNLENPIEYKMEFSYLGTRGYAFKYKGNSYFIDTTMYSDPNLDKMVSSLRFTK